MSLLDFLSPILLLFYFQNSIQLLQTHFFYRLYNMKATHKRKTFAFEKTNTQFLQQKRKHNSTATCIQEEDSRMAVFDVIGLLLARVYEEERERSKFLGQTLRRLSAIEANDAVYFRLELEDEQREILCREDAQPIAEENRALEVVKNRHLKKTSKKRLFEDCQEQLEIDGSRMTVLDPDKRDREIIIQKLKKEYSLILQSKYFSESTPIGESRTFFAELDTPEIVNMRKNFGKTGVKKQQQRHKPSFVEEEIRKHHKLNTVFKKSKDYVEATDPTMSNSVYVSQLELQTTSQRGSVVSPQFQQQSVTAKLSKFKDVSNGIKPKFQLVSDKNVPTSTSGKEGNKIMINLIAQQEREALKLRVERSFHSNEKAKFREVSQTERKIRPNNAISVSFLPRIARI